MKMKKYKWYYERPWFPRGWWRPRELFSRLNWMSGLSPSYPEGFRSLFNNVRALLTPWYRQRRLLIKNVANANGCKLLSETPSSCYMRTRGFSQDGIVYYRLECGLFRAAMYRERTVNTKTGANTTNFMAGISCAFGDGNPDDYETISEKVLSGPCFTRRQCERLLGRIVDATPDCCWYGLEDDEEVESCSAQTV